MITNYNGTKITANEKAKLIVADKGENAVDWATWDLEQETEKEIEQIDNAIEKHLQRVREFLGVNKIARK